MVIFHKIKNKNRIRQSWKIYRVKYSHLLLFCSIPTICLSFLCYTTIDDTYGEINLYCNIIVNKAEKDDTLLSQMEQWSIWSNVVNYIQYDRHQKCL